MAAFISSTILGGQIEWKRKGGEKNNKLTI